MRRVDCQTNALPINQPTDTASYRGALSHLKVAYERIRILPFSVLQTYEKKEYFSKIEAHFEKL